MIACPMEHRVEHDPSTRVVTVIALGNWTQKGSDEAWQEGTEAIREHRAVGMLHDHLDFHFDISTVDVFERAELIKNSPELARVGRNAVLIKPETDRKMYDFWATVMGNRGLTVKIFDDRNEAVTWLTA